jgi:hypothetical protein
MGTATPLTAAKASGSIPVIKASESNLKVIQNP